MLAPPLGMQAQLARLPNTTLALPLELPAEAAGYTGQKAFGSLTFSLPPLLSETGAFAGLSTLEPHTGIVP